MRKLKYRPLERLHVPRPVNRSDYIVGRCEGRSVLDLGCYDETALVKRDAGEWLHGRIASVATSVIGVDNSAGIPADGVVTGPTSRIIRGDVTALEDVLQADAQPEVIVAGELIEHLADPSAFLNQIKLLFEGRRFIASTPNATQLSNVILGLASRESNHQDHVSVFSFKTLSTLCLRAGFTEWRLIPYHVQYTEMALRSKGPRRAMVQSAAMLVGGAEVAFPLLSAGFIIDVARI